MRVAMLAPENSPSWGGVGAYTYNLVRYLPQDVEIHLITLDRNLDDPYEKLFADDKRIRIHKILSVSPNGIFLTNFRFQKAVFRRLKKLHKLYKFDLIHSHSGHLPHFFSQFQSIAPIIVTPHGESKGVTRVWRKVKNRNITESVSLLFSPVIELGEKISLKKADRLLPNSKFTLERVNKEYGLNINDKARVVYNGVDTSFFVPEDRKASKEPTITFAGRFYAIKGFDVFVDAASVVMQRGYNIKLLLLGRGDTEQVKKLLSALPQNSYSVIGRVNYHDMPEIYHQSDIIVVPSRYESCGGVVMEAMSCSKVVIASKVGGIPEIIQDGYNGILFQPENIEELAEKIIDVIDGRVDVEKVRRNARKTVVEKFDWKIGAKQVYEEYLKITG